MRKSSNWQFFDNTKELLAFVAAKYGNDVLFARKHFSDHRDPLIPAAQMYLMRQAFELGAVKILQNNMNSDRNRKETAVKQAVGKMTDMGVASDTAHRTIWEFTNAIGWDLPQNTPVSTGVNMPETQRTQATDDADRRKLAKDAFNNACEIMDNAHHTKDPNDYRKAIAAFKLIDSNFEDINREIKINIGGCERIIQRLTS